VRSLLRRCLFLGLVAATGWPPRMCAGEGEAGQDPRVKPGARFSLAFPKLPKTQAGQEMTMEVRIPDGYNPRRQYGLLLWMDGGGGNASIGTGAALGDNAKFVLIGLPFPEGTTDPRQANMVGNPQKLWACYKPMLEELHRVVPNIAPWIRIASGYSNGGHALNALIEVTEFWQRHFNVYILAEGGQGQDEGKPFLNRVFAGRHIAVFWGDKSPSTKLKGLRDYLRTAQPVPGSDGSPPISRLLR